MTEFFKDYILSLAGITVFGSVCEMLIPQGVYKKYLELTVGIVLVCALIFPIVTGNVNFSLDIPSFETESAVKSFDDTQKNQVINLYKQKLSDKIKDGAGAKHKEDFDIKCEVLTDDESFGVISSVCIIADKNADKQEINCVCDYINKTYGIDNSQIKTVYSRG